MAKAAKFMERLATEPKKRLRQQLLLRSPDLWRPETVSALYAETVRLARIDLTQAERLARAAEWVAGRTADESSQAVALRAVGHVFYLKDHYQPALDHYRKALEIYDRLEMQVEAGRTMSGALHSLIYLGRYDEAFAWAARARDIFTRHQARMNLAILDHNMANVLYRLDRFEEALDLYRRAQGEFIAIDDRKNAAIALKNIATCQISLGQFQEALETYRAAREFCLRYQMPLVAAEADYNIAYFYYLRGKYHRAIAMYRATREQCVALGNAYHQGLCDLDQSEMYLELNLSEEGAFLAQRAFETFRQLGVGYETAKSLTNLAIASSHHGDVALALALFRQAREIFLREGNRSWTAMIDLYQALVVYPEGRLADARRLCERALQFFGGSPLAGKAALCEMLLARICLQNEAVAEARQLCQSALDRLATAETPAVSYQAWFVMGLIEEAGGRPRQAFQAYQAAHHRLEALRSHLKTEETKVAFLKDKLAVYEALVRLCLERRSSPGAQKRAFAYIEQAKSRSLADLIAYRDTHRPNSRQAQSALIQQVGTLREELTWYTRSMQLLENGRERVRTAHVEKLRRAARECEQRLVEAMTGLREEDPDYANLEEAPSIDLEMIRSALPPDVTLLQFYRVRDTFYACLLTRASLRIEPVGPASEVKRLLQLLRFQLSKFRLGSAYLKTFQKNLLEAASAHLEELYRHLIAPIVRYLLTSGVIIAPHEFLHYLPFHALNDGQGFFGDRFSVSYVPSASVYYACTTRATADSQGALVMGVPDAITPQIERETRVVASVLPDAEVYLGCAATYEVLREKGAHSKFIHIATHGCFRQDNPMFSSITLGNGELSLFDLYQMSLPAELVTLSGCGTGLNVVVGGDELLGLKRGLLYAGAQSILLTLWDVNDQSTADFMKLFYESLRDQGNKAKAAQSAMAEIRKVYKHPFYWAPFVIVGKDG